MGKNTLKLAVVIALLALSADALAATRYVSDELSINMRRGPSTSYGITELLEAGTQVQTLEQTNGWTRIRTPAGETGYVLTRLLSSQPAASDRIAAIKSQLADVKKQNKKLSAELAHTRQQLQQLQQRKRQLVAENKALKTKLERIKQVSAHAMELSRQNQKFREQLMALKSEVERLRSQNKALQSRREGMKIGALILIAGIILGLILPMFRRRKKDSWNSL